MVAKATKASYAMGSVLHNRKLDTEIRRVVLLAKLRPVSVAPRSGMQRLMRSGVSLRVWSPGS